MTTRPLERRARAANPERGDGQAGRTHAHLTTAHRGPIPSAADKEARNDTHATCDPTRHVRNETAYEARVHSPLSWLACALGAMAGAASSGCTSPPAAARRARQLRAAPGGRVCERLGRVHRDR